MNAALAIRPPPVVSAQALRAIQYARWLFQRGQVTQAAARLDYARWLLAHR